MLCGVVGERRILREYATSRYFVRERAGGPDDSTSVRDVWRTWPIGTFPSYEAAKAFVERRLG